MAKKKAALKKAAAKKSNSKKAPGKKAPAKKPSPIKAGPKQPRLRLKGRFVSKDLETELKQYAANFGINPKDGAKVQAFINQNIKELTDEFLGWERTSPKHAASLSVAIQNCTTLYGSDGYKTSKAGMKLKLSRLYSILSIHTTIVNIQIPVDINDNSEIKMPFDLDKWLEEMERIVEEDDIEELENYWEEITDGTGIIYQKSDPANKKK